MIADPSTVRTALLAWYDQVARDLPWRREPTPYHVLLSELMLQQTRVETATPYYLRFLERWPRLDDLASATLEEVLQEWAGLGYYRRARHLHAAARAAVDRGGLPRDPDLLRELPGIGPYTAGAIASIAFCLEAPLVDGNVARVLSRLDARVERPDTATGRRALWERAEALVRGERPGDLNQSLMELGATVCTPRGPRCDLCPVREHCLGLARGLQESLPTPRPRKRPRVVPLVCGVARQQGRVLAGRRPPGELLGGLWEPLCAEWPGGAWQDATVERCLAERAGTEVFLGRELGSLVHVLTHRRLEVRAWEVQVRGEPRPGGAYAQVEWVDPEAPGWSALGARLLTLIPPRQLPLLAADEPG